MTDLASDEGWIADDEPWWSMPPVEVGDELQTDLSSGLGGSAASTRLEQIGANELPDSTRRGPWRRLSQQFADPLVVLLLGAIALSLLAWWIGGAQEVPVEPIVIALIVAANSVIGWWQEGRAIAAVESLRALTAAQTTVVRDGLVVRVPTRALVPGDVAMLADGDAVGFDGRLVDAASLEVDEATLTGESLPIAKSVGTLDPTTELADRVNMVHSGTAVTRGRGRAVVVGTGSHTQVGRIAALLQSAEGEPTPLERQVERLGRVLGLLVVVLAGLVVVAIAIGSGISSSDDAIDAALIAVSLAVAAVPEGLPAILTVVLALGVQRMSGRNAVVKRLRSVETLGSASVICTDKTGTLTRNEMTVVEVATPSGEAHVTGSGYDVAGELVLADAGPHAVVRAEVCSLLWAAAAASDAVLDIDGDAVAVQGDPTEIALLVAEAKLGLRADRVARSARLDEVPFDADRKLMSVADRVAPGETAGFTGVVQFTKGAPDVLVGRSIAELRAGEVVPMSDVRRAAISDLVEGLAERGLRTLGVAYRTLDEPIELDASCEHDLVWLGLVGIADPPRLEVEGVLRLARSAGIAVTVVTGDHPTTAMTVARQVGLAGGAPTAGRLAGVDWENDAAVDGLISSNDVFARVTPEDKLRLVRAFQQRGHVVAMTGDGVNDAPALRQADIGVAMGGIGTDVSREAADMILTDDDFGTIVTAIEEGRHIFADIRKFLRYLLGSNTGEVLVMVIGVLLAAPLGLAVAGDGLAVPLLATQILWINLLTDSTLALALGVDPDVDDVMSARPRRLDDPIVDRSMWVTIAVVGVTTAIAGLIALDMELAGGLLGGDGDLTSARTMVFTTLVLAQVVNAFNARSDTASALVRAFDNRLLWIAAVTTVLLQIAVVHLGVLNSAFDTTPLDAWQWLTCSLLAGTVLATSEVRKWAGRRAGARRLLWARDSG